MFAVFTRELSAFFKSITGFIFMGIFLLITGIFFMSDNLIPQSSNYVSVLGGITFVFLVVVPILTMRTLSEERHQKTDQLLLTSPLSIGSIVLGKYLAAVAVFIFTLIITLLYPLQLSLVGSISVSEIAGGYIGIFLLGCAFIAIGQSVPMHTLMRTSHGRVIDIPEYRDLTTGFYVLPRVSNDVVTLEISTSRDRLEDIHTGTADVQHLTTTVSGRLGEWMEIGALMQQLSGQKSGILDLTGGTKKDMRRVLIKVDEVK